MLSGHTMTKILIRPLGTTKHTLAKILKGTPK